MRRCAREAADKAIRLGVAADHSTKIDDKDQKRMQWMAIFDKSEGPISAEEAFALYQGSKSSGHHEENKEKLDSERSSADNTTEDFDHSTQGDRKAESQVAAKYGGH